MHLRYYRFSETQASRESCVMNIMCGWHMTTQLFKKYSNCSANTVIGVGMTRETTTGVVINESNYAKQINGMHTLDSQIITTENVSTTVTEIYIGDILDDFWELTSIIRIIRIFKTWYRWKTENKGSWTIADSEQSQWYSITWKTLGEVQWHTHRERELWHSNATNRGSTTVRIFEVLMLSKNNCRISQKSMRRIHHVTCESARLYQQQNSLPTTQRSA